MPEVGEDQLLETISSIYDAGINPDEWDKALDRVCQITKAAGFNVFLLDHQTGLVPFNTSVGIPDEVLAGYNSYYVTTDPGIKHFTDYPNLDCYYNYLHTPEEDIDKNEYYSWLQAAGGSRYYLAKTCKIGERLSVISTAQRSKNAGHAQQDDINLLGKIGPHLQRAVQINQLFKDIDLRVAAAYDALENLPYGIFLFDRTGAIVYVNDIGRQAISNGDGLFLKGGGGIGALHPDEDAKLQNLIGGVSRTGAGKGVDHGGVMSISSKNTQYRYFLQAIPLAHTHDLFIPQRPVGMIMLGDPARSAGLKAEQLQALFNLTPAESQIALLLSEGARQEDICLNRGISLNTLKTHRHRIFDKIGVRSQVELIQSLRSI